MRKVDPLVEHAVDTLDLPRLTRRRLLTGAGLASASLAASALLAACSASNRRRGGRRRASATSRPPRVAVRLRQPRHDEPVLHPHAVRRRGRLRAARLRLTSGPARRTPIVAEMVNAHEHRDQRARPTASPSRVVDRTAFARRSTRRSTPASRSSSYNADGASDDPGTNRLAYIGQDLYNSGYEMGQRALEPGDVRRRRAASSPRPASSTSSPASTARRPRSRSPASRSSSPSVATGADITRGAVHDRRLRPGPPGRQGHVRRRRRLDPGRRADVKKYGLRDKGVKVPAAST